MIALFTARVSRSSQLRSSQVQSVGSVLVKAALGNNVAISMSCINLVLMNIPPLFFSICYIFGVMLCKFEFF